jgi:hypothetical protein
LISRAYRRPAQPGEVERLQKLVTATTAAGKKWELGLQRAIQAVLVNPKFLFRVELDHRPEHREPHPIDEFQLASRMSYFLWSSMPDDELFALAAQGKLTQNLEPQVRRMLKDPKAKSLTENFAMQWLQLRRLNVVAPDTTLFGDFNDKLRRDMLRETELFFDEIVREDRSILDLLDSNFTYLNERLATHYRIRDSNGNRMGEKPAGPVGQPIRGEAFVRVALQGGERGGVLTQASVLTVTSNPSRTSPVKRGKWVLEQLLGTPPPPPPPMVPELPEGKEAMAATLRQRMELHRKNPACASCHAKMDPLGFALENYDAIGAYRAKDGEFAIDASGELPDGKKFAGAQELKKILRSKKELFARNLAEQMLVYAIGRGLDFYDRKPIDLVVADLEKNEYRLSELVLAVVRSDPFRLRRGKQQAE